MTSLPEMTSEYCLNITVLYTTVLTRLENLLVLCTDRTDSSFMTHHMIHQMANLMTYLVPYSRFVILRSDWFHEFFSDSLMIWRHLKDLDYFHSSYSLQMQF